MPVVSGAGLDGDVARVLGSERIVERGSEERSLASIRALFDQSAQATGETYVAYSRPALTGQLVRMLERK